MPVIELPGGRVRFRVVGNNLYSMEIDERVTIYYSNITPCGLKAPAYGTVVDSRKIGNLLMGMFGLTRTPDVVEPEVLEDYIKGALAYFNSNRPTAPGGVVRNGVVQRFAVANLVTGQPQPAFGPPPMPEPIPERLVLARGRYMDFSDTEEGEEDARTEDSQ